MHFTGKLPKHGLMKPILNISAFIFIMAFILAAGMNAYAGESAADGPDGAMTGKTALEQENGKESRGLISINVADADIRDVLSILAINMDAGIIYLEEPFNVTFSAKDMEPVKALQILLQSYSREDMRLGYITSGDLVVVGSEEKLEKSFFNQMALTRFKLSYLAPGELESHLKTLGVPAKLVMLEGSRKYIWAQGTPQALAKVSSVIAALDRAENFDEEGGLYKSKISLTPVSLRHITADRFERLIFQLQIDAQVLRVDTNPWKLWINGPTQAIKDVEKLAATVDVPENAGTELALVPYKMKNLVYDKLAAFIAQVDNTAEIIKVGASQKQVWLYGEQKEIDKTLSLIKQLDVADNGEDVQFFVYTLRNITPAHAKEKLEFLDIPEISVMTPNLPGISRELLVKCPYDMMGTVSRIISNLDVQGQKTAAPVDYAKSAYQLTKRKDLICKMMGIPPENLIISDDVSRDGETTYYIMWTIDSPENIERIKEMIKLIDSPQGG